MTYSRKLPITVAVSVLPFAGALAAMSPAQKAVLDTYLGQARTAEAAFEGSSARGEAFFQGKHAGGKPDTPSCTSCHTSNLKSLGKTRAGKDIAPMAASANPKRYVDPADVEKWLKRNCSDVLGRECTAREKVDVLTYLLTL
jgi:cytochrome c553